MNDRQYHTYTQELKQKIASLATKRRPGRVVWGVLLVAGCLFFLSATPALADVGPKPQMDFEFEFQGDAVSIVEGQLIECQDMTCQDGEPLQEMGPQRFTCTQDACSSMAYGYAPYHMLVVRFEDGTRQSNVFEKKAFSAHYNVVVNEYDLVVSEYDLVVSDVRRGVGLCLPAVLTIFLETLVAFAFLAVTRLPKRILVWVLVANLLTLPVVWLVFPLLEMPALLVMLLSEGFAFVFEALFLFVTSRRVLSFKRAILLSALMNVVSFLVGIILL